MPETIRKEVLSDTLLLIDLQKDIIQIQQWLTDISATRAAEGFDDGFELAEQYYSAAKEKIDVLISGHAGQGESERADYLEEIENDLESYYQVGVEMAQDRKSVV